VPLGMLGFLGLLHQVMEREGFWSRRRFCVNKEEKSTFWYGWRISIGGIHDLQLSHSTLTNGWLTNGIGICDAMN